MKISAAKTLRTFLLGLVGIVQAPGCASPSPSRDELDEVAQEEVDVSPTALTVPPKCANDAECSSFEYCSFVRGGICTSDRLAGAKCSRDAQCDSGLCASSSCAEASPPDTSQVVVYSAPSGAAASPKFRVRVRTLASAYRDSFVHFAQAPAATPNVNDGANDYRSQGTSYSHTSFSFRRTVEVEVERVEHSFAKAALRPSRYALAWTPVGTDGKKLKFRIDKPGQKISVEFDGDLASRLVIFADPLEAPETVVDVAAASTAVVNPGAPIGKLTNKTAVYFKPGVHDIGLWRVPSNIEKVYLSGGSLVYGAIKVGTKNGFALTGRGVLSGKKFAYRARESDLAPCPNDCWNEAIKLFRMDGGDDVLVDGVTFSESPHYTVLLGWSSKRSKMRNFKIIASFRYNNDGIDAHESSEISDCFINAMDDSIKISHDDVNLQRCVVWQGRNGAVFQYGWYAHSVARATIKDFDVIHTEWGWPTSQNNAVFDFANGSYGGSGGLIEAQNYENIRVEGPVPRIFALSTKNGQRWSGLSIKNLAVSSLSQTRTNYIKVASGDSGSFANVKIANMTVDGTKVTTTNADAYFTDKAGTTFD